MTTATLDAFLNSHVARVGETGAAVAETVRRLAEAAVVIRRVMDRGMAGIALDARPGTNAGGDLQTVLDIHADETFLEAARRAPVALYASEELHQPVLLDRDAPIALAIDPLDGSYNIETNLSIGTIFSLLPAAGVPDADPAAPFLRSGANQLAAGFFIYGPRLAFVLSLGSGTHVFVFSPAVGAFVLTRESLTIAPRTQEFAINASNYRHWDEAVRLYIDDCLKGSDGPREKDFNMRWTASLVAECFRILTRGGVFLYPGDGRRGYQHGRLRLVYEANPIAFLVEQAGGAATDAATRILDIEPGRLHQRIPFVFGSAKEVERIARYHTAPSAIGDRAPLFGNRGLFRA